MAKEKKAKTKAPKVEYNGDSVMTGYNNKAKKGKQPGNGGSGWLCKG